MCSQRSSAWRMLASKCHLSATCTALGAPAPTARAYNHRLQRRAVLSPWAAAGDGSGAKSCRRLLASQGTATALRLPHPRAPHRPGPGPRQAGRSGVHVVQQGRAAARQKCVVRNRDFGTTRHNDTPDTDGDGALPVEVEVTDPTHPLFGRRFLVIAVTRTLQSGSYARVDYRPGNPLVLPLGVTSLPPGPADGRARTKLTPEALAELVAVAGESEAACPSNPETCGPACGQRCADRSPETSAPFSRR